jgi:hypothetical protein
MTIHIIEKDERESKFAELRRLSMELSVPVPEVFIRREIKNPCCEPIIKEGRSHTYVRNFYNLLSMVTMDNFGSFSSNYGAGYLACRRFDNGTILTSTSINQLSNMHNNTVYPDSSGILCGTDNTAYSFEQYQFGARITNGTGAGQLTHVNMVGQAATYDSGTKVWSRNLVRVFNNNSSGSIGVKEVGIVTFNTGSYVPTMIVRDVLSSTDTINNGGQYTVTYTVKMTFPE